MCQGRAIIEIFLCVNESTSCHYLSALLLYSHLIIVCWQGFGDAVSQFSANLHLPNQGANWTVNLWFKCVVYSEDVSLTWGCGITMNYPNHSNFFLTRLFASELSSNILRENNFCFVVQLWTLSKYKIFQNQQGIEQCAVCIVPCIWEEMMTVDT